uniref:Noggin n=1 Tax=Strigamia maritima TaxID=126957 RepID=T1IZG0_STRMM
MSWLALRPKALHRKVHTRLSQLSNTAMALHLILLIWIFQNKSFGLGHSQSGGATLHPSPSHDLPVLDLIEPTSNLYDPHAENLDSRVLRQRLGTHFDPRCMSVQRPLESLVRPNSSLAAFGFKQNKMGRLIPLGRMPRIIRTLELDYIRLPNGKKVKTRLSPNLKRKMQQFLWLHTHCSVVHVWKDLGNRFWPRWLREGRCVPAAPHFSCSFPRGMSCKPSQSVTKVILRWHCKDWESLTDCDWIQVRYPLVTACSCSC